MSGPVRTLERVVADWREAFVSATMLAASARLPDGLYTTLRTYDRTRILRPAAHAERLSARGSRLTEAEVMGAIRAALKEAPGESRIRITFAPPRLFVSVEPFETPPADLYATGARCVTVDLRREDPGAKKTNFIAAAGKAYADLPLGVHEGLLVGADGAILEGLSSNVFFVVDEVLRTEGDRALPGVTRSLVLEVGARVLPVLLQPVGLAQVPRASECFLTSVSRGILPVAQINGAAVGDGCPGVRTMEMIRGLETLVRAEAVPVH